MLVVYSGFLYESNINSNNLKIVSKSYQECSRDELDLFADLLITGNEVVASSIPNGMRNTLKLVFVYKEDELVAVSAIKIPSSSYVESIFEKAGVEEFSEEYKYEFGYTYVKPEYRRQGIADLMLKERLKYVDKAYSTTRTANIGSIKNLENNGFTKLGDEYKSFRGDYYLQLMVKN
jgi:GNAT superfamily N-acetyltransferase